MSLLTFKDSEFPSKCVAAINSAVTDDILEDIRRQRLSRNKMNSTPSRIWDFINRNISETFAGDSNVVTGYTTRGPWKLVPIFDKKTGFLFTIMREERFYTVRKDPKNHSHYVYELAEGFNFELQPIQQTLISSDSTTDTLKSAIQRICDDLLISQNMVKKHALILFSSNDDMLLSVRCCMINKFFEECESVSWNEFIKVGESSVVDQIINLESKFNNPTHGLTLSERAKKRKKLNADISAKSNSDISKAE